MKKRLVSLLVLLLAGAPAMAYPAGYSIGLNFGADEPNGAGTGALAANEVAGVPDVKQGNWNNLSGASGSGSSLIADNKGASVTTSVSVEWTSPNTWSSTGRGEENNGFAAGPDRDLLTGFLDTGNATTTYITITGVPNDLTSGGYNVYVYMLGGVSGRGGSYRITDDFGVELKPYQLGTAMSSPSVYVRDLGQSHQDTGNYLLFKGLTARNIIIEATTEMNPFGGTPRAPVNAVQLAQAPDKLNISAPVATPVGFSFLIEDSGKAVADLATLALTLDGAPITATSATKNSDGISTVTFKSAAPFASGSTHQITVSVKDTLARSYSSEGSFTVPPYSVIPASAALADGVVDKSKPGFIWRVHQTEMADPDLANTLARAEDQLAGKLGDNFADPNAVGPASGPANPPTPANAPIEFAIPTVINLNQIGGNSNGNFGTDDAMPGIPGVMFHDDNIAAEILTALEFPAAGLYTMIVNSDDGFRTSAGANPKDLFGALGQFDGGRGSADTLFRFWIEAPGLYAFRTIWQEGGGGADIEWLSVLENGTLVLINDTANAQAVKAYQLPSSKLDTLPAYVRSVTPAPNSTSIGRPKTVEIVLVDAGTQVNPSSVTLKLNGANAAVTATKTGLETKVVHTVVGDLLPNTEYAAEMTYADTKGTRTVSWKFRTGALSSTLFLIEAEDFDYSDDLGNAGLANPKKGVTGQDVDVMPYFGGAYADLSAIEGIDYNNNDGNDSNLYRTELDANGENEVNIAESLGAAPGTGAGGTIPVSGSDRGSWNVTINHRIGWVEGGSWQNYTRTIPVNPLGKWWKVYAALSYDGAGDGQLSGSLDKVVDGFGTAAQTVERLGQFSAPGSGGWGRNDLVVMKTAAGAEAVIKLEGKTTLRFNLGSGDFDFILLSAAPPPPPFVESAPMDSVKRNEVILDWTLRNTDTSVNVSTVKLFIDGQDVTANATIEGTDTGATIHVDLAGTMFSAGEHVWRITFTDNGTVPQNVDTSGKFVVNPYPTEGVFVIEAEDFNYSEDGVTGGKTNPQRGTPDLDVDVMPYLGNAYNGLSAIKGVDFNNNDDVLDGGAIHYRTEIDPDPEANDPNGENEIAITISNGNRYSNDRGVYDVTSNYRIGWVGTGDWNNFTRTFPSGNYNVWAALSFDGRGAGQLNGSLSMVTTDPAQPNQITSPLGTFSAPGSGGWGRNELVPMKDSSGAIAAVQMGGVQTVRFNMSSGDFDYLLFVPVESALPEFTVFRLQGGNLHLEWTGGGTLEAADAVTGPWNDTAQTSPVDVPIDRAARFWRVKR
ncbi:MAG: hypothetical protein AB1813_12915 [Verrucomicrobiota bacterium]